MRASSIPSWRAPAALLIVCSILLAPLLYTGYFQPHSGFLPVYTLYAWEAAGFSPLNPAAHSPSGRVGGDGLLPYVLAELLRMLGADGGTAVKAVFALALLLAAGGTYRLVRRRCARGDSLSALALAVIWAASPMMLSAVYVRGSLGGALALGLLPWLAAATESPETPTGRGRWPTGLGPALLIALAHPGFALLAAVALVVTTLLQRRRPALLPVAMVAAVGLLGLLLGAGTAPAPFLQFSRPYQWFTESVGYAVHNQPWGPGTPAPLTLGFLPLGLFAITWLFSTGPGRTQLRVGTLIVVALLLLGSIEAARPLWQAALSRALEGPWQLVALAGFLLLYTAAPDVPPLLRGRGSPAAAVVLLALAVAVPALGAPLTRVEPAARPLATFADGQILLVGAELEGPLRHGATPRLRLHWQATVTPARDYTVFVHVVDGTETKWGQRDSWPADGQRPTTSWRPGEVVTDEHPVYIAVEGPREGYRLLVGLYDLETGERLPLADGRTALELLP